MQPSRPTNYARVFGDDVASGLGLGSPDHVPKTREEAFREYHEDPAEAFSRVAELMQIPGGGIPYPFASPLSKGE